MPYLSILATLATETIYYLRTMNINTKWNNSIDKCWLQSPEGGKTPTKNQNKTCSFGALSASLWNMLILNAFQGYHLTCCDSGLLANMFGFTVSGQKYFLCKHGQVKVQKFLNSHFVWMLWGFFPTLFSDLVNFLGDSICLWLCVGALCLELLGPKTGGTFHHSKKL